MIFNYDYPLLNRITESFKNASRASLENTYIWASQHILEPQEKMIMLISEFGVPVENIHVLGKIYSTNFDVLNELNQIGCKASQPEFDLLKSFDEQHKVNCLNVFRTFMTSCKDGDKVIILDDGASLLDIFNSNRSSIDSRINFIGIEQTSSGFRKLEKTDLGFPVINVARSGIKLEKESPLIAKLGCNRIKDAIEKYHVSKPRILVVGLGPIGSNVMSILKDSGYAVYGHDITFDSNTEVTDIILKGNINILIGATGSNILSEQQIQQIESNISERLLLVSMSSADREFPASFIRLRAEDNKNIHEDNVWKRLILVNNGFPITFKGKRYESTPSEIEKTIALLYGSVLYAATHDININGFVDVPKDITDIINKYTT
jgi:S-adenosylhomocysteine hydrolase